MSRQLTDPAAFAQIASPKPSGDRIRDVQFALSQIEGARKDVVNTFFAAQEARLRRDQLNEAIRQANPDVQEALQAAKIRGALGGKAQFEASPAGAQAAKEKTKRDIEEEAERFKSQTELAVGPEAQKKAEFDRDQRRKDREAEIDAEIEADKKKLREQAERSKSPEFKEFLSSQEDALDERAKRQKERDIKLEEEFGGREAEIQRKREIEKSKVETEIATEREKISFDLRRKQKNIEMIDKLDTASALVSQNPSTAKLGLFLKKTANFLRARIPDENPEITAGRVNDLVDGMSAIDNTISSSAGTQEEADAMHASLAGAFMRMTLGDVIPEDVINTLVGVPTDAQSPLVTQQAAASALSGTLPGFSFDPATATIKVPTKEEIDDIDDEDMEASIMSLFENNRIIDIAKNAQTGKFLKEFTDKIDLFTKNAYEVEVDDLVVDENVMLPLSILKKVSDSMKSDDAEFTRTRELIPSLLSEVEKFKSSLPPSFNRSTRAKMVKDFVGQAFSVGAPVSSKTGTSKARDEIRQVVSKKPVTKIDFEPIVKKVMTLALGGFTGRKRGEPERPVKGTESVEEPEIPATKIETDKLIKSVREVILKAINEGASFSELLENGERQSALAREAFDALGQSAMKPRDTLSSIDADEFSRLANLAKKNPKAVKQVVSRKWGDSEVGTAIKKALIENSRFVDLKKTLEGRK